MKRNLVFISFLWIFWTLLSSKCSQKIPDDFSLEMRRIGCRGTCPAYHLTVNSKGEVEYRGVGHVKNIGTFTKTLNPKTMNLLFSTIQNANFEQYIDDYSDHSIADLPGIRISVARNGIQKTIQGDTKIPMKLLEEFEKLEKIIGEENYLPKK